MNHFVYACMGRVGRQKLRLFAYVITQPIKSSKETCKTFKTFVFKLIIWCKYTCKTTSSHMECSIENVFLKISQIHRKTPVLKSLSNNVTDPTWQLWTQVFSCEFRKKIKTTGRLLLENFLFKLIRQTFIHGRCIISEDCARNFVFSGL